MKTKSYQSPIGTVSALIAAAVVLFAIQSAKAQLVINFEGGSADYDANASQTTGKFRDTANNSAIGLSSNGAGNDYITIQPAQGASAWMVYDTTPADGGATTFSVPTTGSLTATMELFHPSNSSIRGDYFLSLYNPSSSATNIGAGAYYRFSQYASGPNEMLGFTNLNSMGTAGSVTNQGTQGQATISGGTYWRMTLSFENIDGLTGRIKVDLDQISGFGGAVSFADRFGTYPQFNSTEYYTFTYGTGSNVDLNPSSLGVAIGMYNYNGGAQGQIDNFTVAVVPEPTTWVMIMSGAGVLVFLRHRRG